MNTKREMIWGALVHVGFGMWGDKPQANLSNSFDWEYWKQLSEQLSEAGTDMLILDLGEAMIFKSHPELAIPGSVTPEKMLTEVERLRKMGFNVCPKLNFSTSHDGWLGDYGRMISTKYYYKACEEIVKDVFDVFGKPQYFHIGWEEEDDVHQRAERGYRVAFRRQGELWWHDFFWLRDLVTGHGSKVMMFCDYPRKHPNEFYARMPKDVMMSPWDYRGPVDPAKNKLTKLYVDLDQHGYDQVITGSNCYLRDPTSKDPDSFINTVKFALKNLSREHMKGFIHAPWCRTIRKGKIYVKSGLTAEEQWSSACAQIALARRIAENMEG